MESYTRRRELLEQLDRCRKQCANADQPRLRGIWCAACALVLAAVCLFVFANDLYKLLGILPLLLAAAICVCASVHYLRIERQMREILKELARLDRGDVPERDRPDVPAPAEKRFSPTGKQTRRIV